MQKLKNGKEEIIYLLLRAIEKYTNETGQRIIQNTNRKNYESLAILLSEISNQLPERSGEWGTEPYAPDVSKHARDYPHRKYDISGGQVKDALIGIVSSPRSFLVDACYIYLYGMGRKAFSNNPVDENLLATNDIGRPDIEKEKDRAQHHLTNLAEQNNRNRKRIRILFGVLLVIAISFIGLLLLRTKEKQDWEAIRKDMNLLPYKPSQSEIDSLEGIWLCYTGSPQARISDASRYHKVVSNLIDIKYKDGYFIYNRFGASFNHVGYMQFESPGIISVFSRIKNNSNTTESPRHSLLNLYGGSNYLPAISASWNFDVGDKNRIIGIREIYIKQGKGGRVEEVINEIENASCQCKVIRWHQPDNQVKTYYLKNQLLDSLPVKEIRPLINEQSILLGTPQPGLVITKDSTDH